MVFATGDLTEMGRIAGMMNLADDLQTPLTRKIAQFGQHPRHLLGQDRHAHAEGKSRPRLPLPQGDRTRSQGRSVGYLLMQETSVQRCCPSATLSGHPAGRYPIADCPSGHPAVGYPTADSLAACESHEV